ncbi:NHLP leader peptide family RiPP precursor [Marinicrinis sediminis]|uniref:NHLP leader peptide family RiPP n=1 Tax=Marinicrinis sediminis TaxID=1652465 RepID=A0ABW5RDW5_9BACL
MSGEEILKHQIIQKAWEDPAFKSRLLKDPKAALKEAFDLDIPKDIQLDVLEESSNHFYLVLPVNPADLSDDDGEHCNGWW